MFPHAFDVFAVDRHTEKQGGFFMAKWSETQKKWGMYILFLCALFLFFKFILPLFAPFVLAFIIVAPLEPVLERLSEKLHIGKSILAGAVVTILLALLLATGLLLASYVVRLLCQFVDYSDRLELELNDFTGNLCKMMEGKFHVSAEHLEVWMGNMIDQMLGGLEADLFPKVMNQSVVYIRNLAKGMIFGVILWIAAVLLSKDFVSMKERFRNNYYVRYAKNELKKLGEFVKTFLLAQLVIMGSISVICMLGLLIGGFHVGEAVAVGMLTGILDALPFLGTGIVLLLLALWQLIKGEFVRFGMILLVFFISVFVRELLEPRLIGGKMGLWPVAMLMSVYVGAEVFGPLGVILGPVYLIIAADWYFNAEIGNREPV